MMSVFMLLYFINYFQLQYFGAARGEDGCTNLGSKSIGIFSQSRVCTCPLIIFNNSRYDGVYTYPLIQI